MTDNKPVSALGNDPAAAVRARLFELGDPAYADFTAPLVPDVRREDIIGVRFPELRALAKELSADPAIGGFLEALPHRYLEEKHLHALIIERERDLGALIEKLDAFLPFVDNWATCDTLKPKLFSTRFEETLPHIRRWAASGDTYSIRFAVGMLMANGLGERFRPELGDVVAGIVSGEYYVNMMRAWYFATALAKNFEGAEPYLDGRLDEWTHNKTIQKACESRRIKPELKEWLRGMRRGGHGKPGPIQVAAGVIWRDGRVLICRRGEGKARAGLWEFPGGKLEPGENAEQALVREIREELGCTVRPLSRLCAGDYIYDDVSVHIIAVEAEIIEGEPAPVEHSELSFVLPEELSSFALCTADDRLIAQALLNKKR